ncbi:MAG: TIGR04076 family protein [Chloroflexi bacterium]|nr:TIGR04076 family protein [Chloroflexota bacterium]
MAQERHGPGHRVVGTIKSIQGNCGWGHKVGDTFDISVHNNAGLCGLFYHDIFPWIMTLQFGGENPWGGDRNAVELECMDRRAQVKIELRRMVE